MQSKAGARAARLRALLVAKPFEGSRADLGRALGYRDGSMIYQMLTGRRPITEKTAARIEALAQKHGVAVATEVGVTSLADAIRTEGATDGMALVDRGLAALLIVGRAKDNIMDQVRSAARDAAEVQKLVMNRMRKNEQQ